MVPTPYLLCTELLKIILIWCFLLIHSPPPPHTHTHTKTKMFMQKHLRRNVLPQARVNFSQSETNSLLSEGEGLNFELLLLVGGLTGKILKLLLKKLKHFREKIQKWSLEFFRFMQLSIMKNPNIIWRKN